MCGYSLWFQNMIFSSVLFVPKNSKSLWKIISRLKRSNDVKIDDETLRKFIEEKSRNHHVKRPVKPDSLVKQLEEFDKLMKNRVRSRVAYKTSLINCKNQGPTKEGTG